MNNAFAKKRERILSYRSLREKQAEKSNQAGDYLRLLFGGSFEELFADAKTTDPLDFPDYQEKLETNKLSTGLEDALICGIGTADGVKIAAAQLCPQFLMGSMGTVVGDKIAALAERADRDHLPLVIFSASGGARMQEGMYSLMQMAKTSAAVQRFKKRGGLFISVLTHPTTGGVSASYAFLGDIILAEPGALIGFAGPRVIEKTIGEKLPEGFQRAEFQKEHGMVDRIVPKERMKREIVRLCKLHGYGWKIEKMPGRDIAGEAVSITETDSWKAVQEARSVTRPRMSDYLPRLFDSFMELSGDRLSEDDSAILGGIATIGGMPVTVIGHRKGKDLKANMKCRFGMPQPSGYRKALRLMKQAEKFRRPVITFVDTPGAYPGKEAEENGQSIAIAENLAQMSDLKTPILTIVTGEGASGGALGLGVADRVWMLEHAVYYVLSPEGFATILWKDEKRSKEASKVMQLTAAQLYEGKMADRVLTEPIEGLREGLDRFCAKLKGELIEELRYLQSVSAEDLTEERYRKYRDFERLTYES